METVDPKLLAQYRELAATGMNLLGLSLLKHKHVIHDLIRQTGSRTLLDYGSGAGRAYKAKFGLLEYWGVERPVLYDPAFPHIAEKPVGTFDGVLCSDVLEHVDLEHVHAVLFELFEYADKFVFVSTCSRKAKKNFPSGRNLHCTVMPFEWWEGALDSAATCEYVHVDSP